jgi:queuosine precursor transporter
MNRSNQSIKDDKRQFFAIISSIFVATLIISNTVGGKVFTFYGLNLPGGVIVFPISYIFGDVLTEVYGYKSSRVVIWTGLICLIMMSGCYYIVQVLPPASFWNQQEAYQQVLGTAPKIALASSIAYFLGEFSNSFVMAKMKIFTNGNHLWTRTIGSTIIGQAVDTAVFCIIAFTGVFPPASILAVIVSNYIFKVAYEVIATPITYSIVKFLKKVEKTDVFDEDTDFNPFKINDFRG